ADLSHNVSTGKRTIADAGLWPHGKTPAGYKPTSLPDKPRGMLLTPNKHAHAIIETFTRVADVEPLNAVRRYLSAELGRDLSRQGLHSILRNEVYTGKIKCNGETFDGL